MIPTVTVTADKNPDYTTPPGSNTQDQVFLLSIPEVKKYFSSEAERQCKPTDYAKEQGCFVNGDGNCAWWLRSPGYSSKSDRVNIFHNASVRVFGAVDTYGDSVSEVDLAVRPALWINLATPGIFIT